MNCSHIYTLICMGLATEGQTDYYDISHQVPAGPYRKLPQTIQEILYWSGITNHWQVYNLLLYDDNHIPRVPAVF